jgi:hypothetical protein
MARRRERALRLRAAVMSAFWGVPFLWGMGREWAGIFRKLLEMRLGEEIAAVKGWLGMERRRAWRAGTPARKVAESTRERSRLIQTWTTWSSNRTFDSDLDNVQVE